MRARRHVASSLARRRTLSTAWLGSSAVPPATTIYVYVKVLSESGKNQMIQKIQLKHLIRVARELGEQMSNDELQEMIDEADRGGHCMHACIYEYLPALTSYF